MYTEQFLSRGGRLFYMWQCVNIMNRTCEVASLKVKMLAASGKLCMPVGPTVILD